MTSQASKTRVICISDDWFAWSHFRPLLKALTDLGPVILVTKVSHCRTDLEAMGVTVVDFDYARHAFGFAKLLVTARKLDRVLRNVDFSVLHAVSTKIILLCALARWQAQGTKAVFHFTGLGKLFTFTNGSPLLPLARRFFVAAVNFFTRRNQCFFLFENEDDRAALQQAGLQIERSEIVPGAGLDPALFAQDARDHARAVHIVCLARMLRSKGILTLAEAHQTLLVRGVAAELHLYGDADPDNIESLSAQELAGIANLPHVTWRGRTADAARAWAHADIAVVPSLVREGMPRAMLEAAAASLPLVASDVPGPKQFMRSGVEGFLVPPGDVDALADALARLCRDEALRKRMGHHARRRLDDGFTESQIIAQLKRLHQDLV